MVPRNRTLAGRLALGLLISSALMTPAGAAQKSSFERHLYWGDTHLHTSNSFDVYMFDTPNATPETAYRFARGEEVISPVTGKPWKLSRPLDFLVVADHAELMGTAGRLFEGDPELGATASGKSIWAVAKEKSIEGLMRAYSFIVRVGTGTGKDEPITPRQLYDDMQGGTRRQPTWNAIIDAAERYNEPGKFTAFVGWEWSSTPGGGNLHRIVFTPDGPAKTKDFLPFSQLESDKPEDLWKWLGETRDRTGADFLAIPHNSNLSWGKMFPLEDSYGKPIDAEYARNRMRWERVVETTQVKGDSETHPAFSPNDEFADFERFNFLLIPAGTRSDPNRADYVRTALMRGLELEKRTGVNPFQLGMIGSTDSHTGMSAIEETAFSGKSNKDALPEQRSKPTGIGSSLGWDMAAQGLVAVWAPSNDRRAIFEAFRRREVYASTGPRMAVRMFAGYGFSAADARPDQIAAVGYSRGVPMGGELTASPGSTPAFLVEALKDSNGANLDRIQIVKGWIDSAGVAHEKVFDVTWSGNRRPGRNGKLPAVGNTVDIATGRYTNSIGAVQLRTLWRDPEYRPGQKAFYYARVLEIPTPRYSLYDAIKLRIDPRSTGKPLTIQERAYTSPIWIK